MEARRQEDGQDGRDGQGPRVRRRFLLTGLAATVAGVLGRPAAAEAQTGEPLIVGERNTAQSPTELLTGGAGPGLAVRQTPVPDDDPMPFDGVGVAGLGDRFGVLGSTLTPRELSLSETSAHVRVGVSGFSDRFGMLGSTLAPGELTISAFAGVGVSGVSHDLGVWGVRGAAPAPRLGPAGVLGSATGEGTAVAAENEAGFAFRSLGRLAFSTAGEGLIPAGETTGSIENAAIDADSLANVTLLSSPGGPARLVYAAPQEGRLTVHLSHAAKEPTRFAYFVFHSLK